MKNVEKVPGWCLYGSHIVETLIRGKLKPDELHSLRATVLLVAK